MAFLIRAMADVDVEPAADVVRRGRWGERGAFFAFAVRHEECHPFVAELEGEIVGSGVGTRHGVAGWVGMIFVDEARRNTGIGSALTSFVVDDLRAHGCATLLLVATPAGRPIYERLGFEVEDAYVGFTAPEDGTGRNSTDDAPPAAIRSTAAGDVDELLELDAWATGEDRSHLVRAVLGEGGATSGVVAIDEAVGRIAGFTVPSGWGGWPAIARTTQSGLALLEHRRAVAGSAGDVRTSILERNVDGLAAMRAAGWTETWRGVRMRLGPSLDWHPEAIWGQFNFGVG